MRFRLALPESVFPDSHLPNTHGGKVFQNRKNAFETPFPRAPSTPKAQRFSSIGPPIRPLAPSFTPRASYLENTGGSERLSSTLQGIILHRASLSNDHSGQHPALERILRGGLAPSRLRKEWSKQLRRESFSKSKKRFCPPLPLMPPRRLR